MSEHNAWRVSPLLNPGAWGLFLAATVAGGWATGFTFRGIAVAAGLGAVVYGLTVILVTLRRQLLASRMELGIVREHERLLNGTLDRAPEGIWRCDASGGRSFISKAWERATGQSVSDALSQGWFDLVHPEDLQRCRSAYRVASVNREQGEVEYRVQRKDGEDLWMLDRFEPCLDSEDKLLGFIGVSTEITQRKREEADRRQQIDDLLRASDELTSQLAGMAARCEQIDGQFERIRQTDQSKSQYLAAMARDFRTPIEKINNVMALLNSPDLPESLRPFIKRGLDARKELDMLLGRAIEMTTEDAQNDASNVECNLWELVQSAIGQHEQLASSRGVELTPDIDGGVPVRVSSDPVRLVRVLGDLVAAAITLVEETEVVLRVERERTQGEQSNVSFVISLHDDGIPSELVDRAFYPRQSVNGEPGGLGLGPAQRLAQQLDGRVGVERDEEGNLLLWFSVKLVSLDPTADGRRSHARLPQECVRSSLGSVLDLSMGGMRVQCRKVPEDMLQVELHDEDESVTLTAQVAWSRRVGFRRYEVGLTFVDVTLEQAAELGRFAARNRLRRAINAA